MSKTKAWQYEGEFFGIIEYCIVELNTWLSEAQLSSSFLDSGTDRVRLVPTEAPACQYNA
jgi:hypothetical protein